MALRMTKVASDPSLGDLIGQDFGPYRLVRRLGVGGMAQTFEAIRHGPGDFSQRVCLKLVLPFFRDNQAFVELFKQEAKLAAKLRHGNIVGVIDFGEIDGTLYMALELVDGVDLQVLLDAQDRKRLPHEHVALVGRDLARALEHAHNPPGTGNDGHDLGAIIHRDISPSNVMISRHGEVLLTDFGVAKAVTNTQGEQSNVKGKIPYMSPEQLMGEALDGRADLFAVGVVLFEALTGKRPYAGANEPATIMLALAGDHVPLSELAPDTPARAPSGGREYARAPIARSDPKTLRRWSSCSMSWHLLRAFRESSERWSPEPHLPRPGELNPELGDQVGEQQTATRWA